MTSKYIRSSLIAGILAIVLVYGFFGLRNGKVERVTAEEKSESVQVIPGAINSEEWQNIEAAKTQDLGEDEIFNNFNMQNSAYIVSAKYRELHSFSDPASVSEAEVISPSFSAPQPSQDNPEQKIPGDTITPQPTIEPMFEKSAEVEPRQEVQPQAELEPNVEVKSESGEVEPSPLPEGGVQPTAEPAITPKEPVSFIDSLRNLLIKDSLAQEIDQSSGSYDRFISCDDGASDCLTKKIEFGEFGIADALIEKPIKNIQLRFSLAAAKENLGDNQVPGRILIEYYFKNSWNRAGEILITDEISNSLNGGYFLYALPDIKLWEELNDLKVRLSVQYFGDSEMNIFLDGLWLEADADFQGPVESAEEVIIEGDSSPEFDLDLVSSSESFDPHEIPAFSFNYKKEKGVFDFFGSFFKLLVGKGEVVLEAVDQKVNINSKIQADKDKFRINFDNSRFFIPGRHRLKMKIFDNGSKYRQEQEFLWGTLFINLEKSSYKPGEIARIFIEVLDDLGNSVCDAKIEAVIKSSLGRVSTFSIENNIYSSGKCLIGGDQKSSGFYFDYQIPPETGLYTIELKAETSNGPRKLTDKFEVADLPHVEINRVAPISIKPGMEYEVSFSIKSDKDFDGLFKEIVPANFEIIPSSAQDGTAMSVVEESYSRIISWPVSLKAGEPAKINYSFRALNSVRSLYVLGPASLDHFQEPRPWQMISSKGDKSTMLNNNSVHSCKIEPFTQAIQSGGEAVYTVKLTASEAGKPFLLSLPDLPPELSVSLSNATGDPLEPVTMKVLAQPDMAKGSSNYILVYQEREANGAIFGASCQFNLVVE